MTDLEIKNTLREWLDVRMASYTDAQYGKGAIRSLLTKIETKAIEQTTQGEPVAWRYESPSGDCFYTPNHVTQNSDWKVTPLYTAPPAPSVPDDVRNCLTGARAVAMQYTLEARIPECGYFAAIAQDLDYVCHRLLDPNPQAQEIPS